VRAELRSLTTSDGESLATFVPERADNFAIAVRAMIGPAGAPGEESFDFTVCTAAWLVANPPQKSFAFLHGHLLVTQWDSGLVKRAVSDLCLRTDGGDWNEIATSLSRLGYWEFDNYRA
jgi:hypothetical protein